MVTSTVLKTDLSTGGGEMYRFKLTTFLLRCVVRGHVQNAATSFAMANSCSACDTNAAKNNQLNFPINWSLHTVFVSAVYFIERVMLCVAVWQVMNCLQSRIRKTISSFLTTIPKSALEPWSHWKRKCTTMGALVLQRMAVSEGLPSHGGVLLCPHNILVMFISWVLPQQRQLWRRTSSYYFSTSACVHMAADACAALHKYTYCMQKNRKLPFSVPTTNQWRFGR